jgi:hypothetical protein
VVFSLLHPLAESDPAERPDAPPETPAAEAAEWLTDPQPPPPPQSLHEQIAREIDKAIGWPLEKMQAAIAELDTYPGDENQATPTVPPSVCESEEENPE